MVKNRKRIGQVCVEMQFLVKKFHELTVEELYEILRARAEIFVVEQNCVYQDLDGIDKDAYHICLYDNGELVAYLRVIDKGKRLDEVSLGRVITIKRKQGYGKAIMEKGCQVAKEKFNAKKVKIGAQVQAQKFYEKVGFVPVSGHYLEDGIPHIYMEKTL